MTCNDIEDSMIASGLKKVDDESRWWFKTVMALALLVVIGSLFEPRSIPADDTLFAFSRVGRPMPTRIDVTDEDIAREFRLLRCVGSASEALTSPGLRIALANCAAIRKQRDQHRPQSPAGNDAKRRAAGDTD